MVLGAMALLVLVLPPPPAMYQSKTVKRKRDMVGLHVHVLLHHIGTLMTEAQATCIPTCTHAYKNAYTQYTHIDIHTHIDVHSY